MAPIDSPDRGNADRAGQPTLSDRVDALEGIMVDLMEILAVRDPALKNLIDDRLTDGIRLLNELLEDGVEDPDDTPNDEVVPRTAEGKAIKAIRDQFITAPDLNANDQ